MPDAFNDDQVTLRIGGAEIPIVEDYTVRCGVLEVPAQFEVSIGHGGIFYELAARFLPWTPFELYIGSRLVQIGETDGYGQGQGATIVLKGRDLLARIWDTEIEDERTIAEKSYASLVKLALKEVGLGNHELVSTNAANRKAITGKEAKQLGKKTFSDVSEGGSEGSGSTKIIELHQTLHGEVGKTWFEIINPPCRRAGLFLWMAHDGKFVLDQPNGFQAPMCRILVRRGSSLNEVNVEQQPDLHNDATKRYSEIQVLARGGGGKHGRGQILGRFIDEEVVAWLNPDKADRADGGKRKKPHHIRDSHVSTPEQANFLARREMARCRREGWRIVYTVAGHTAPAIGGGRVIWQPDTVHEVIDDERGIEGPMYLESVTFARNAKGGTHTKLHMMRIEDLVFAEALPGKAPPKLKTRRGVTTVDRIVTPAKPGGPVIWFRDPDVSIGSDFVVDDPKDPQNGGRVKDLGEVK